MFIEQKLCNSLNLLEIGQDISLDNIKKAYRKMAKKYHPDLFLSKSKEALSAENKMKMINEAKELIDNFIDMYGLDELLRIYKTTNKINEFITLEEVGAVCSKDSELIVFDTIMNNCIEINAKRIFKILYSIFLALSEISLKIEPKTVAKSCPFFSTSSFLLVMSK